MGTIEITESNHKDYSSLEQYKADKKKYEGVYFFCTN
jgi:hypothetical protein